MHWDDFPYRDLTPIAEYSLVPRLDQPHGLECYYPKGIVPIGMAMLYPTVRLLVKNIPTSKWSTLATTPAMILMIYTESVNKYIFYGFRLIQ